IEPLVRGAGDYVTQSSGDPGCRLGDAPEVSRMNAPGSTNQRQIGAVGTASRAIVGLIFLFGVGIPGGITVIHGRYQYRLDVLSVILGAIVFPAAALASHWWFCRRHSTPLLAHGIVGTRINLLALLALFLIPWLAPRIYFISTGAAVFYGASMLLAASRANAAYEVPPIHN